jgi:hypothetical protein
MPAITFAPSRRRKEEEEEGLLKILFPFKGFPFTRKIPKMCFDLF